MCTAHRNLRRRVKGEQLSSAFKCYRIQTELCESAAATGYEIRPNIMHRQDTTLAATTVIKI
jgi:hypothetical protein